VQTAPLVVTPPAALPMPQVITPIASLITTPEATASHTTALDNKG